MFHTWMISILYWMWYGHPLNGLNQFSQITFAMTRTVMISICQKLIAKIESESPFSGRSIIAGRSTHDLYFGDGTCNIIRLKCEWHMKWHWIETQAVCDISECWHIKIRIKLIYKYFYCITETFIPFMLTGCQSKWNQQHIIQTFQKAGRKAKWPKN